MKRLFTLAALVVAAICAIHASVLGDKMQSIDQIEGVNVIDGTQEMAQQGMTLEKCLVAMITDAQAVEKAEADLDALPAETLLLDNSMAGQTMKAWQEKGEPYYEMIMTVAGGGQAMIIYMQGTEEMLKKAMQQ